MQNLYDLLMISRDADAEEIERAYKSQAKYYDPEITGDNSNTQFFQELKLAYETLINPKTKEEYDIYL